MLALFDLEGEQLQQASARGMKVKCMNCHGFLELKLKEEALS